MGTPLSIQVRSWKEAAAYVHLWPTHRVSLLDPDDAELVATSPRPDLVTLEVFVADVTDPAHPAAATPTDVARLLAFGTQLPADAKLLCHCRGGIGRSPAAAMIALAAAGWPADEALDQVLAVRAKARPNPWLLLLADEQREVRAGGLLTAWLSWSHRQPFFTPVPDRLVRDALAGRLRREDLVELVKAQTHKRRGVSHGRYGAGRG